MEYAKSLVPLDIPALGKKQRDESIIPEELSAFRGRLEQLMKLATQVVPQLRAHWSWLLGYVGIATVSTMFEANKLARRALIWALPGQMQVGLSVEKAPREVVISSQ